jgi:retrograde regulation protein 2
MESTITLDNLRERIPRWHPAQENHLYGLVDMGSNGIRFSISNLQPPETRRLKCVYRERAAISLFDALSDSAATTSSAALQHGQQPPLTFPLDTIVLTAQTLARFRSIAMNDYHVPPDQFFVFATEAMRRAANAADMLEAIGKATAPDSLTVNILAPQVETLLGGMGARSAFADVKGLFLDLGGGSVQMSYINTWDANDHAQDDNIAGYGIAAAQAGESLPFGAAKLIKTLESADMSAKEEAQGNLSSGMHRAFSTLKARFPALADSSDGERDAPGHVRSSDMLTANVDGHVESRQTSAHHNGIDIYLCGGGFRGYGSMLMHNDPIQPYPIPIIGGYTVSGTYFRQTQDMLRVNEQYTGKVYGMSKRRRQQFPAIVAVVEKLIGAVPNIRSVTFCAGGNREGFLMMMLPKDVREMDPLLFFNLPVSDGSASQKTIFRSIEHCLENALPEAAYDSLTVFTEGLGSLISGLIWKDLGEDPSANAESVLHDAVSHDTSCPGLSHLGRAVLGLTLCARWGDSAAPSTVGLRDSLRRFVDSRHPHATFWADYIGAVAAALAQVMPAQPDSADSLRKIIRYVTKVIFCSERLLTKYIKIQNNCSERSERTAGIQSHHIFIVTPKCQSGNERPL